MTAVSCFFSIIVLTVNVISDAENQQHPHAERQHRYAEELFVSGDYQAARRAYKRLLFYQPNTQRRALADYRIAHSYYRQNLPKQAERLFREFSSTHLSSTLRFQSQLMLGQLQLDAKRYSLARTTLFELLHISEDPDVIAAAHYLRGWCYVYTSDWNKAIAAFRQADTSETDTLQSKKARQLADTLLHETPLSFKSPEMVGRLSTLIPGSGQLYVGNVKAGLLTAATTGAFIYLAADALREDRYVDCVGIALVGGSLYWHNRNETRRLTSEDNRHREQAFIETLKRQVNSVQP